MIWFRKNAKLEFSGIVGTQVHSIPFEKNIGGSNYEPLLPSQSSLPGISGGFSRQQDYLCLLSASTPNANGLLISWFYVAHINGPALSRNCPMRSLYRFAVGRLESELCRHTRPSEEDIGTSFV